MTHTRLVLACMAIVAVAGSQVAGQITVGGAATSSGAPAQILNDLVGGLAPQGTKPMPAGGGIIVGRVIDGVDGTPIAGAIVSLALPGFSPERVQADGSGQNKNPAVCLLPSACSPGVLKLRYESAKSAYCRGGWLPLHGGDLRRAVGGDH